MKQHFERLQADGAAAFQPPSLGGGRTDPPDSGEKKSRIPTRAFSAVGNLRRVVLALVCAAMAGSGDAALNLSPAAENLFLVVAAGFSTACVLKGSDPNRDPITFKVTSFPAHGTLSGVVPNLTYNARLDFVGMDTFTYVVNDDRRHVASRDRQHHGEAWPFGQ